MNNEVDIVCDPVVNEVLQEKAKHPKSISMGKFLRERAQAFLTANQGKSDIIMSDRIYRRLLNGWALQRPETVL